MNITGAGKAHVVIGMQYGSEGKGKIVQHLIQKCPGRFSASVRVGAPNAGHTMWINGKKFVMRHVPCAWLDPNCILYIGAAGMVNYEVLRKEIEFIDKNMPYEKKITDRLFIDLNACVITEDDVNEEKETGMNTKIGSTQEGVGAAMAKKIRRRDFTVASMVDNEFKHNITRVSSEVNALLMDGLDVLLEGTQGFGLCINHGNYPFTTSRDVLASSLLSDVGISPYLCGDIIGVVRTFPIRVAGNSGQMKNEVTWKDVKEMSGYKTDLIEKTTVTQRVRRVGLIDWDMLQDACRMNHPNWLAVTFMDYINAEDYGKNSWADLSPQSKKFITEMEHRLTTPVKLISTGERAEHCVWAD